MGNKQSKKEERLIISEFQKTKIVNQIRVEFGTELELLFRELDELKTKVKEFEKKNIKLSK